MVQRIRRPAPSGDADTTPRGPADRDAVAAGAASGALLIAILTVPRVGADPLWLDEAYSLGVVNQFAEGVRGSGGTMVGYYALLWIWTRFGESPAWLRLGSTLLAMAAMVPLAALGGRLGGRRLAVLAPMLLAGAYMFRAAALEVRAYTLEILLVTSCWYVLVRAVQAPLTGDRARRWWVVLAVLGPLGICVHGLFVLFVAAMVPAVLIGPRPRRDLLRLVPALATTAAATVGLAVMGLSEVGHWVPATDSTYLKFTVAHYLGDATPVMAASVAAVGGIAVAAVVARIGWWRRGPHERVDTGERLRWWSRVVPLVWFVVPPVLLLFVSLVRPGFVDRYLVAITPAGALVVGTAVCMAADVVGTRLRRGSFVFVVVVGAALVVGWTWASQRNLANRTVSHWDEIAGIVATEGRPGDALLLYGDLSRPPFEAAWSRIPHRWTPEVVSGPRPLGEVRRYDHRYPLDERAHARVSAHDRVWVVAVGRTETAAVFYELVGPLPERYRLVESREFLNRRGPTVVRLYERDDPG